MLITARAYQAVEWVLHGLFKRWWSWRGRLVLTAAGVRGASHVICDGVPIISLTAGSTIEMGERVVLCSHSRYTALGVARPVVLRTLTPAARIVIGEDVGLSGAVICAATSVEIGARCLLGADVQVTDTDFHPVIAKNRRFEQRASYIGSKPVVLEENVFLGAGVRVLKGVRIGRDSVVGAGSVVTHDLPAGVVAAGVPARVIGLLPSGAGRDSLDSDATGQVVGQGGQR